jgi:hypothetical protein
VAEQTGQQERLEGTDRGRRRAAGIYGAVVTAAVIAAVQDQIPTRALVVAVLVTLLVYWIAEEYAELLGEHAERGHLPTWPHIRAGLAASWPMVAASFVPLLVLVASRLAGASTATAANVGLIAAVVLLVYHGWSAGRAAHLAGRALLAATSVAAGLGLVMVLLKDLVLIHLH